MVVQAAREVKEWGGRLDISAPEALMELVSTKAAEVAYWNLRVAQLDESERAGMLEAKRDHGEGPQGPVDMTTHQAGPHIYLTMLHKAQDQLAAYSAAAVRAGVDEALVKIAAVQASAVIDLARAAIEQARLQPDLSADDVLLQVLPEVEAVAR